VGRSFRQLRGWPGARFKRGRTENEQVCLIAAALVGGVQHSLWGALAWIVGIVATFVPLSIWRYRRMS
jgi:hypothetical protein